jgi:hypothetical protein
MIEDHQFCYQYWLLNSSNLVTLVKLGSGPLEGEVYRLDGSLQQQFKMSADQ